MFGDKTKPPNPIEALSQSLLVCILMFLLKFLLFFYKTKFYHKKYLIGIYMIWFTLLIK